MWDVILGKATAGEFDGGGIFPQVEDLHETVAPWGGIHHRSLAKRQIQRELFIIKPEVTVLMMQCILGKTLQFTGNESI